MDIVILFSYMPIGTSRFGHLGSSDQMVTSLGPSLDCWKLRTIEVVQGFTRFHTDHSDNI